MGAFLSWCWQLTCFRANPSQLPQSFSLMLILVVLSIFAFILSLIGYVSLGTAVLVTIYVLLSQMALIYLVLSAAHKQERYVKTMTAILLVSLVFQCLALPFMFLIYQAESVNPVLLILFEAVIMFVQIWLMFVHAYIINCAINVGQLLAFIIVIVMSVVQLKFLDFLMTL